jgi:hypothetical protein
MLSIRGNGKAGMLEKMGKMWIIISNMAFIRKFKTGSGATGVQVCWKQGGEVVKTVHIGSANSEVGLEKLLKKAQKVMDEGKTPLFDLDKFDK